MLKGGYLRVQVPITRDGMIPAMDAFGRMMYRTYEVGLRARRDLDNRNAEAPEHLKMIIEEVNDYAPAPKMNAAPKKKEVAAPPPAEDDEEPADEDEMQDFTDEEEPEAEEKPKAKRGRKAAHKTHE